MIPKTDMAAIIDWITCPGQSEGMIAEGEITREDVEIEAFVGECRQLLVGAMNSGELKGD